MQNDGYKKRLPEILKYEISVEEPWKALKDKDNKSCWKRIDDYCVFNKDGKKEVIIIGDSHVATLSSDLKENLLENDFFSTNVGIREIKFALPHLSPNPLIVP